MNRENAKIRIEELRGILEDANRRYYVENAPTISDRDFDFLMKELEALEKEWPEFDRADSPSHHVGSDLGAEDGPQKEFDQYPHR